MKLTKEIVGIAMILLMSTLVIAITEQEQENNVVLILKTLNAATKSPYYKDLQTRSKTDVAAYSELENIDLLLLELRNMETKPPEEVNKTSSEILSKIKAEIKPGPFDRVRQWISARPALGTAGKAGGIGLGVIVILLFSLFMFRRFGRKGKTAVDAIVDKGKAMFGDIERHLTAEERWIDEFKRQY